ncbi:MAG: dicarboxylate/amino acid:cation symporter [Waddliaceae bacterium]|nr:dicarboxylate/amino acid:cation symporter [Waddliaceae bacterium]
MKLWVKIVIGMFVGVVAGAFLGPHGEIFKPVGTMFLNLINMLVMLLVFASMTVGITSIHDPKKLGRIGFKTLGLYFLTTTIAIIIGLIFVKTMRPGADIGLKSISTTTLGELPSITAMILNMVPSNPIRALAEGQVLQVIVFAIFLGIAINAAGSRARPLLKVLEALAEVMYKLTDIVMKFAPYGVCATMAWVAGAFGLEILLPLGKFLTCNFIACVFHILLVYCGMLFIAKLNPLHFFKGMGDAIAFAFSTSSSTASLPITMHCVQENLGVSKNLSNFILPLGATVNMNGAAIAQAVSALFIAQAYGIELSMASQLSIIVTATLSAVGAAGIPGTGFIMLSVVLTAAGLPLEGLALIAGVDRLREMVSTVVNVLGDAVVAVVVAKNEGELDEDQYRHTERVALEESDL